MMRWSRCLTPISTVVTRSSTSTLLTISVTSTRSRQGLMSSTKISLLWNSTSSRGKKTKTRTLESLRIQTTMKTVTELSAERKSSLEASQRRKYQANGARKSQLTSMKLGQSSKKSRAKLKNLKMKTWLSTSLVSSLLSWKSLVTPQGSSMVSGPHSSNGLSEYFVACAKDVSKNVNQASSFLMLEHLSHLTSTGRISESPLTKDFSEEELL